VPIPSVYTVVRELLTANLNLSADDAIRRVKARGISLPDPKVRRVVHNTRNELKKKATKAAPAAARQTAGPKPRPAVKPATSAARPAPAAKPTPAPVRPAPAASGAPDLSAVFANVALVNRVVAACGGVENARQVAEAVRVCGGVDVFLQHLDLVAGIRTTETTG
jgi:hypothetical protein